MKGKEILQKEYPLDEMRMRTYINCLQDNKNGLINSIDKFKTKIEKIDIELKELEKMTLEDWLIDHPNKY